VTPLPRSVETQTMKGSTTPYKSNVCQSAHSQELMKKGWGLESLHVLETQNWKQNTPIHEQETPQIGNTPAYLMHRAAGLRKNAWASAGVQVECNTCRTISRFATNCGDNLTITKGACVLSFCSAGWAEVLATATNVREGRRKVAGKWTEERDLRIRV